MTPDLKAIEYFLRIRYNYWSDDAEHENVFPEIVTATQGYC